MNILVFNCGSSSLTFKVFKAISLEEIEVLLSGKAHRVGVKGDVPSSIEYHYQEKQEKQEIAIPDHAKGATLVLEKLKEIGMKIDFIGNRWGHSAGYFTTAWVDENLLRKLQALLPLLPIHHPAMLSVIEVCQKASPGTPQYVTADGAFHSTIPKHAYTYALPKDIIEKFGFRKYGFHGISYQYVIGEASHFLKIPLEDLRIVACHLGTGGSSVVAVQSGKSIDTSMGYTALPGLMMSTRCGDVDPTLTIYLMFTYGYSPDDLVEIFNKKSGLLGISGFSSDIRDIIHRISEDQEARLAFNMYVQRVKKYVGSYILVLGGIDLLLFTDDIGVHNWLVREKVCEDMEWCGLKLDKDSNRRAVGDEISRLNTKDSKVQLLSLPTEEELVICWEGVKLIQEAGK
jgi:acetate kinase